MENESKHMKIYKDIKNKINKGAYKKNEKLPDGNSLAQNYFCSRMTVKKALDLLAQEGMITKRRGAGTFVKGKSLNGEEIVLGPTAGLVKTIGDENISSKIISFTIEKPDENIMKKLGIEDEYIYIIIRARFINDKPYSIEHTYMPLSIIKALEPKHLESSIYNYIRDDLNLKMGSAHVWIKGSRANKDDCELLGVDDDEFMMEIEKISTLEDNRTFEYSITRHIHEDFVFETIFVQN